MTSPTTYANHLAVHQALDAAPLLRERGLGVHELATLICLARHLGKEEPTCWVSLLTISEECLFSSATAMRAIQALRDAKFVSVSQGHGRSNHYTLDFRPVANSNLPVADSNQLLMATSSCGQLPPVANSNLPVADSNGGSCCQQPEVINEVVNKVVKKEVVNRSSSDDEDDDRSPTPDGQSGSDRKQEQEQELADLYFDHLGSPKRLTDRLTRDWPNAFRKLLTEHSAAELKQVINWAFLTDTFWPEKLKGIRRVDPVVYFAEKLPTILTSYKGGPAPRKPVQSSNSTTNPSPDNQVGGHVKGYPQWRIE